MGEPAGIGGEITLAAWRAHRATLPPFFLIGDADWLADVSRRIAPDVPVRPIERPDATLSIFVDAVPVLHRPMAAPPKPGHPDPVNAPAVADAIREAVALTRAGAAAAVVTNPIHKKALHDGGFAYPGHTEFLGELAGDDAHPVMMLVCPALRVVPVTVHVGLRRAIETLSCDAIVDIARTTAQALQNDFSVAEPRLAVAGLNPHAGEQGDMGNEDEAIIAPAVAELHRAGIDAFGPVPPDTLFTPRARAGYDVAICMYHDQALIPLKALDFDGGVNVTLGLPFIRTSPDHGTAFDLAGTGQADPASLIAALRLAGQLADRRRR